MVVFSLLALRKHFMVPQVITLNYERFPNGTLASKKSPEGHREKRKTSETFVRT